jgi:hypothetical protein
MLSAEELERGKAAGAAMLARSRAELKTKALIVGVSLLLFLAGLAMCTGGRGRAVEGSTSATDPDSVMFESKYMAIQKLKYDLRDPASAKFRDVEAYKFEKVFVFCGEVNANNGFGGKSGFVPFFASFTDAYIADDPSKLGVYVQLSSAFCSPANFAESVDF